MPSQTPNLDLYKVNGETDGNDTFNVDVVLNDNWDKIDAAVGQIQEDLGSVTVPDASLTQKGIVQLSNATNGTRENVAATEKAVKDAYDRGSAGINAAAAAQARADAAFTQANDGKGKVRTAIIGAKGAVGDADGDGIPTFDELAAGVKTILPNATADAVLDPNMLVVGYSGYDDGVKKAGQMPNRSAENHHMPGLASTVWAGDRFFIQPPHGYYNGSSWVTAAVPGLTAANLRAGVDVAGLIGTLVEGKALYYGEYAGAGMAYEVNAGFNIRTAVVVNISGGGSGLVFLPGGGWVIFTGAHSSQTTIYSGNITPQSFAFYAPSGGGTHYVYVYKQ
ncbi:MAG: phage tail protein [Paenibacillus lautus]|uniref:phage tail protein n=1 Tax=Paenibacillus lautus TaxID=1401 RepID=UPI0026EBC65A|nr:phage tail protein [Paenibacillus lautus]MCI1778093.1 phage tail protein [Paenibacillus lautus]